MVTTSSSSPTCCSSRWPTSARARRTTGRAYTRGYAWPSLLARDGDELFDHYRHALEALGNEKGTLALQQGAEQVPGPDQAAARDRRPHERERWILDGR